VLPTNEFVRGDNLAGVPVDRYRHLSFKVLWQNPGYQEWQRIYRVPYYGFGFFMADFYNPLEIGYPASFYGILGIPIFRLQHFFLYSEFQFGITANWQHYHEESNPKNIAVGGGMTVHVDGGLRAFYALGSRIEIGGG
jgi:hypothetical protein